jgi:hypothetical protein
MLMHGRGDTAIKAIIQNRNNLLKVNEEDEIVQAVIATLSRG